MSTDVHAERRTAAEVIAAAAAEERQRNRRRGRWFASALAVAVVYELSCYPRAYAVQVSPRRSVDVRSVTSDAGILRALRVREDAHGPALLVRYFSATQSAQDQGLERLDVFEWARPQAESLGLRTVVLMADVPVLTRLLPLEHGNWLIIRRAPDGTWGGQ